MESFERVYGFWCRKRITQAAAARVLGVTAGRSGDGWSGTRRGVCPHCGTSVWGSRGAGCRRKRWRRWKRCTRPATGTGTCGTSTTRCTGRGRAFGECGHPLPEGGADGRQRQLRGLQGQDAAGSAAAPSAAGPGRSGGMSRSAALLGSLRSPRRARNPKADNSRAPKTGHSICFRHGCLLRRTKTRYCVGKMRGPGVSAGHVPADDRGPRTGDSMRTRGASPRGSSCPNHIQ